MLFVHVFQPLVLTYTLFLYTVHGGIGEQFQDWNRSIITADPSIIIRNDVPDRSFPPNPEFKSQHPDILRGSLSYSLNQTTKSTNINTTLFVLDIPDSARAKWCSFRLDFEIQDIVWGAEFIELWSLETLPVEFETTWNTRPNRRLWLGIMGTPQLRSVPRVPYNSNIFSLNPVSIPFQLLLPGSDNIIVFPCLFFIGKTGFELAALPSQLEGFKFWAWNTAGLTIEIHHDPWTLSPQHNFTISPLSESTLQAQPEFDYTNFSECPSEFSFYSIEVS